MQVTYKQNGRIIPVNSKGNPIKNVVQPLYVTEADDATKVKRIQGVPRIMNYIPEKELITIEDPEKNTRVIYYTFSEIRELSEKKLNKEKQANLKNYSLEKREEKKKVEKIEERNFKKDEKKISKKETGIKDMFSWFK